MTVVTPSTSEPNEAQFPSLVQIKESIPARYFRSNTALSLYYVARDIFFVLALFGSYWSFRQSSYASNFWLSALATFTYCFLQGTVFWGIFVLGHDCGHGSFSPYPTVNTIVGNFLHSFILAPYEPWKLSHKHHHKNTNNLDRDEVFYPIRQTADGDDPSYRYLIWSGGLSWYLYIWWGYAPRPVSHLSNTPAIYQRRRRYVDISIVCWLLVFIAIAYSFYLWGSVVFYYYVLPDFIFATWLVVTTFLHHHEHESIWYSDSNWDYVKGNLNSFDRSYWPFDNIVHDIGTHQVHHLFPIIPHYHLTEATQHFRAAFPHLVRTQNESIVTSFFKNANKYWGLASVDPVAKKFSYAEAMKVKSQ